MKLLHTNEWLCLGLLLMFGACTTLGTRIVYESADNGQSSKKVGVVFCELNPDYQKAIPAYKAILTSAVTEAMKGAGFNCAVILDSDNDLVFESPDPDAIATLCKDNAIDSLVLIKHQYSKTTYFIQFVPWDGGYDSYAEAKLISSGGKLLRHTTFNTLRGKAYMLMPTPETTAHDSIVGVVSPVVAKVRCNE